MGKESTKPLSSFFQLKGSLGLSPASGVSVEVLDAVLDIQQGITAFEHVSLIPQQARIMLQGFADMLKRLLDGDS